MNEVNREEKKFLISIAEAVKKAGELEKVLIQDSHNGAKGYIIRSLYFDTVYDTDYFEKLAGIETRRKVRLRIYDPGSDTAKLELKQKQGQYQLKRSLTISREDAEKLIKCDFSPLTHYRESFAEEMYALMKCRCYRPKTIVQYRRKAFIAKENNIRVTFDSEIVSTESSFELFSEKLNMNYVMDPYDVVMEVKFNGFLLEYIKQLLNDIDKSELSVSKYSLARQNGYGAHL